MHEGRTLIYGSRVLLVLACILVVMAGTVRECEDRAHWCDNIGSSLPLSRCYKHQRRCCRTCSRLQLPIAGCPYGDKQGWCSTLGVNRPAADCYAYNDTCCQTCHLYDSGIPDCPYGDRVTWCSAIGLRYSVSSCYDHNYLCCQTCNQFDTSMSACPYGDRLAWCSGIGSVFPDSLCTTNEFVCCATCRLLRSANGSATNSTSDTDDRPWSKFATLSFTTTTAATTPHSTPAIPTASANTTHAHRHVSSTRSTPPTPRIRHRGHRGQMNRTKTTTPVLVVHGDPVITSSLPFIANDADGREQFTNDTVDGVGFVFNVTAETTRVTDVITHDSKANDTQVHREIKANVRPISVESSAFVTTPGDQRCSFLLFFALWMLFWWQ